MRIQALYDLQSEINRLYIAGSKFAQNDPRLTKHIPVLMKLGEKAPVFKKLAEDIDLLVNADKAESAEKLSDISVLLYSVLYTQGETTADAEEKAQVPLFDMANVSTELAYSQLEPIITALTSTGGGRYEIVKRAFNNNQPEELTDENYMPDASQPNMFKDFRTWEALNRALDDKYADIADLVGNKIIPSIGADILPIIKAAFNIESGKTGDVRRLKLLLNMNDPESGSIVNKVFESNSTSLLAEAVDYLGNDPNNLNAILKYADDKYKPVREAAYNALARIGNDESIDKLMTVFMSGKNTDSVVSALRDVKIDKYLDAVYEKVDSRFQTLIDLPETATDKEHNTAYEKFESELNLLQRRGGEVKADFVEKIFTSPKLYSLFKRKNKAGIYYVNSFYFFYPVIRDIYYYSENAYERLKNILNTKGIGGDQSKVVLNYYFIAAVDKISKEEFFDLFSPHFEKGTIQPYAFYHAFGNIEQDFIYSNYSRYVKDKSLENIGKADKRWAKIFMKKYKNYSSTSDILQILTKILGAKDPTITAMIKKDFDDTVKSKKFGYDFAELVNFAIEINVPEVFDKTINLLEDNSVNRYSIDYGIKRMIEYKLFEKFPKNLAKKLSDIADNINSIPLKEASRIVENN